MTSIFDAKKIQPLVNKLLNLDNKTEMILTFDISLLA